MADDELKQCPTCPVKGTGPFMEKHIFRCGKGIPMTMPKKVFPPEQKPETKK
jgi:hypothetical protein